MSLEKIFSILRQKGLGYYQYHDMHAKKKLNACDAELFPILWLKAIGEKEIEKHLSQSAYDHF